MDDLAALRAELSNQGWRVEKRRKHWQAFPPERGGRPCSIPSSPSDFRSFPNVVAKLRRVGFEWPPPARPRGRRR